MSTPKIKGENGVHAYRTTGRVQVDANSRTENVVKQGTYEALLPLVPRKGDEFEGLLVVSAELVRTNGGMGLLTVSGPKYPKHGSDSPSDPGQEEEGEVEHEVEMAQLEKPLLSHPKFSAYAEQLDEWRRNPETELQGEAAAAAELILKGVESYLLFAPVCRRTTRIVGKAADKWKGKIGDKCGKTDAPPKECTDLLDGSWSWLKTADRVVTTTRGGTERIEEWTGADEWEAGLYDGD